MWKDVKYEDKYQLFDNILVSVIKYFYFSFHFYIMIKQISFFFSLFIWYSTVFAGAFCGPINKPWYIEQAVGIIFGFRVALIVSIWTIVVYHVLKTKKIFTKESAIILGIVVSIYFLISPIYYSIITIFFIS